MLKGSLLNHVKLVHGIRLLRNDLRSTSSINVPIIFDRNAKKLQRNRAAANMDQSRIVDYLRDAVASQVVDRFHDIKRSFNTVVEIGAGCGHFIKHIDEDMMDKLIQCDMSEKSLNRDANVKYKVDTERMVFDEELLPFEEGSLEAVVSSLSLHWINDLPGVLTQIRRCLKPDGVFLGAMMAGDTLYELRTSLQLADLERKGGMSPHISPMTEMRDVGSLLSRAGFVLTTVDMDEVVVNYPTPLHLMEDLRNMGEGNAILKRQPYLSRDSLLAMCPIYQTLYGNEDGTIPATFQIIFMIGWSPSSTQPQPKERGSATTSLKDVFSEH